MSALQIISYHYVRDLQNSKFPKIKGLDTKIFQQQLDYLQSEFHIVTTEQVIASLMTGIDLPDGATWLTFDDGFIDHYEVVFPELLSRGLTAAFFPPAQPILEHVVLDVHKIQTVLESNNHTQEFDKRLLNATYFFAGTFLFSSIMNYVLARWLVTSPSGTQAFNEELGRMTLVSYPMIAIPSTVMMLLIFYYLWRTIRRLTGFTLEEVMAPHLQEKQEADTDKGA